MKPLKTFPFKSESEICSIFNNKRATTSNSLTNRPDINTSGNNYCNITRC